MTWWLRTWRKTQKNVCTLKKTLIFLKKKLLVCVYAWVKIKSARTNVSWTRLNGICHTQREDIFPQLHHIWISHNYFLFKNKTKKTVHCEFITTSHECVDIIFVLCFSVIQWSHSPDTHMASITWTSASCILRPFFMWSAWQLVCCRERGHLQ